MEVRFCCDKHIMTNVYWKVLGKEGIQEEITEGVVDVFVILMVIMVPQVHTHVKTHQIVNLEYLQFIGYQLYLNEAVKKVS